MIHIVLPTNAEHRKLPFYLATEEWVARNLPPREYFFSWIVKPTVICGHNQDINAEVNREYCRQHGIDVWRRKSGGGCVYADHDNLMTSVILPTTEATVIFSRFTQYLAKLLAHFDITAYASGRNDILIDSRKVSGSAFYYLAKSSIVHGTLLFNTNLEHMANAITPSKAKLESKKVTSVESHLTTINEHNPKLTIDTFKQYMEYMLTTSVYVLSPDEIKSIELIQQEYEDPEWIEHAKMPRHSHSSYVCNDKQIPGIGNFQVRSSVKDGALNYIFFLGDYFTTQNLNPVIKALTGAPASADGYKAALAGIDISDFIPRLDNGQFLQMLVDTTLNNQ